MNKYTFIQTLRDGLRGMPQEDVEEIISDFEDHFAMAGAQGKTEEAIAEHLGDPVRIAAAYRGEGAGAEADDDEDGPRNSRRGAFANDGYGQSRASASSDRYVSIHERYLPDNVREVEIDMLSSDIRVAEAPGGELIVDIEGRTRGGISATLSGGHLLIRQEIFRLFDFFNWVNHEPAVTLYLPATYSGALSIKTKNGEIETCDFEGKSLSAHSMSGNVRLGAVKAHTVHIKTMSGEISARELACHTAEIGSVSGNVTIGDVRVYKLQLNNVSGDTRQTPGSTVAAEIVSQNSVSGDLHLCLTDSWKQINANSVSGDLRLKMPDGERFSVELSSVSGRVDNQLGSDPRAERNIRAKTVSGDLRIERI